MAIEFKAIVDAGFVVQIDDPRIISYYTTNADASVEDCRKWAAQRVEVINYAISGISPDMVRFHTCYSINIGPRVHEMELRDFVDIMLTINAGAYSFEAANPRHEHDYHVFEKVKLPGGKVLIPGVISHTTNLVEHPELIAERIVRFARLVSRENVIAGADCGFSTGARNTYEIHPTVVWAKFASLVEGARLASEQLWPASPTARPVPDLPTKGPTLPRRRFDALPDCGKRRDYPERRGIRRRAGRRTLPDAP